MQHFYDGAIRRYVTQTIRVFSELTVRYSDGTLHRIPVRSEEHTSELQSH